MRHRKEKRPLGRTTSHRDALLRNMVTSLIDTGRITTTLQKAKELRRVADRMITIGKRGDLAARRRALRTIRKAAVVKKLFSEVALRSETRPGGYTRVLHLGRRPGDGASMAIIELVDRPETPKETTEHKAAKKAKGGSKKPGVSGMKKTPHRGEGKAVRPSTPMAVKKTSAVKRPTSEG